ncbi:MAG: tripartite tricarboxylate transporter substrate binding protein [Hyphomicrobiales bacterium]|nr:tripartite tricarboxylate transporter substrate binding protein [Hyphomicrobiales bacterium]
MKIRTHAWKVALCALLTLAGDAGAQPYPSRPIRAIMPLSAGGLGDTFLRALGQELHKSLGQPVVVENKPGANTVVGGQACAQAAPDGYTICLLAVDTLSNAPWLTKSLGYDPERSFAPITNAFFLTEAFVVHPQLPVNSLQDVIALSKAKPGTLNYATPAHGVTLFMEKFKQVTGADINMVPYRGGGDAVTAVVSGQVQVGYFGMGNNMGQLKGGAMKPLAVDGKRRSPHLPAVPTLSEAGYSTEPNRVWFGLFAPAGTPEPIIGKLHGEVVRIVRAPDFHQKYIEGLALESVLNTPDEFAAFLKEDRARSGELVKGAGLTPQ